MPESVPDDREESIQRCSQQLGLSYPTTWRILHKDLGLKAHKIQLVRELKPTDQPNRLDSVFGLLKSLKKIHCFRQKYCLVMRYILGLMDMSTNKIIWSYISVFGLNSNLTRFKSCHAFQTKQRFGVVYEPVESSVHISSKTSPAGM